MHACITHMHKNHIDTSIQFRFNYSLFSPSFFLSVLVFVSSFIYHKNIRFHCLPPSVLYPITFFTHTHTHIIFHHLLLLPFYIWSLPPQTQLTINTCTHINNNNLAKVVIMITTSYQQFNQSINIVNQATLSHL